MSTPLLPDALWNLIQPFLPSAPDWPNGGRPRLRARLSHRGRICPPQRHTVGNVAPKELGCGSGMTCWRRLHDWQEAGLIHFSLLDWLARCGD